MALPRGVRRLFRLPDSPEGLRRAVDEEIDFHLAERAAELEAAGWSPEAARREALRRFGDPGRVRAACAELDGERLRRSRRLETLSELAHDLRVAGRQLRRAPAVSLVAVLTLALGIGATTAIFSVVHAVLLRPPPFPQPERVVFVWEGDLDRRGDVSAGNFADWREDSRAFTALAAARAGSFNLAAGPSPVRVPGLRATAAFWRVFAVAPALGRPFGPEEDRPGAPPTVVLSHELWARRFAADPGLVGRRVRIDGAPATVVGVMPPGFDPTGDGAELWVPMAFTAERLATYDEHTYQVVGRLAPGVDRARAQAELRRVSARRQEAAPDDQRDLRALVTSLADDLVVDVRRRLLILFAAVVVVLLIACGNVANLLLAHGAGRGREMAVRAALGARRLRLVRQLLTESLLLALAAAAGGVVLAAAGVRALVALAPPGVPRLDEAAIDLPVVAFAVALAVGASLLAGLFPAFRGSRARPGEMLREGGRSGRDGSSDRLRSLLVTGEVALALVLLVAAGLLVHSGIEVARVSPGFDVDRLLTLRVSLPENGYADPGRVVDTFARLAAGAAALPGVRAAAVSNQLPLAGSSASNGLLVEGQPLDEDHLVLADLRLVSPGYLATLGLPLRAGRALTAADRRGAPRVMLVNETLARRLFPDGEVLGRRVACCEGTPDDPRWKTVVGVVGDVRSRGLAVEPPPQFYIPLAQAPEEAWGWLQRTMVLAVRTAGAPEAAAAPLRRLVARVDPELPVYDVASMRQRLGSSLSQARFNTLLLTLLGAVGLLLAAVGIYGTLAFTVEQRRHEIGVRMALGASAREVVALALRQMLVPVGVGIACGAVGALAAGRGLEAFLFRVGTADPATFAVVFAVLLGVALAAGLVPARRAARVDPVRTLADG